MSAPHQSRTPVTLRDLLLPKWLKWHGRVFAGAMLRAIKRFNHAVGHGPQLAPGEPAAERDTFDEVVLVGRLREAIRRLNPVTSEEARATVKRYLKGRFAASDSCQAFSP